MLEGNDEADDNDTRAKKEKDFSQYISMVRPAIPLSPSSGQRDELDGAESNNTENKQREQKRRLIKRTMERS